MKNASILIAIILTSLTLYTPTTAVAQSNEAKIAYNNAINAFNAKDYAQATQLLETAIKDTPNFELALHLLATCYQQKNNFNPKKAIAYYQQVLAINPNQEKVHYNIASLYMDMEQYPNAQYHLNQAIAINPAYDKAKQLQSVIAYKTNPPAPTTTTTTVAAATNTQPTSTTATTPTKTISKKEIATQYNKGVAAQRIGDNVAAAQEFVKAIALDNTNPTFYYSAGLSYFNMKKYDDAIQYLEQAVARKNNYADAFRLLGHIYMDTRKTKKAEANYREALNSGMRSDTLCAELAFACLQNENYIEATRNYQLAAEIAPNNASYNYNAGVIQVQRRWFKDATISFNKAIQADPHYRVAYYNLGLAYIEIGDFPKALDVANQLLRVDPNYTEAHLVLAIAYQRMDNLEKYQDHVDVVRRERPDLLSSE